MNFICFYNKVHKVQANNQVQKVRTMLIPKQSSEILSEQNVLTSDCFFSLTLFALHGAVKRNYKVKSRRVAISPP